LVAAWLLGTDSPNESVIISALVVVAVVMLILYLKDTILFFIDKKISILYWILYLCTAFLVPLSFIAHLLPQRLG
jgi:Ca2+/Na+ antiporter